MTFPNTGAMLYTQGFGSRPENVEIPHLDVRDPSAADVLYPIGKRWVNTIAGTEFFLPNIISSSGISTANWVASSGGGGGVQTLSNGTTTVSPDGGGNIAIDGTANEIIVTSTPGLNKLTVSLASPMVLPGDLTVDGSTILDGAVTITSGTSAVNINSQDVSDSGVINIGNNGGNAPLIGITGGIVNIGQQNNDVNINTDGFGNVNISGSNGNTTINSGGTGTVDIGNASGGLVTITGAVDIGQNSQQVAINTSGSGNTILGNLNAASTILLQAGTGNVQVNGVLEANSGSLVIGSRLHLEGGFQVNQTFINNTNSPYTALDSDTFFNCNTATALTINLINAPIGTIITIVDSDGLASANNITVNAPGGQSINFKTTGGAPSATISDNFGSLTMIVASNNYYVLAQG